MTGAAQSLIIGTAPSCEIRVDGDPYVSAQHCEVTRRADGTLWVADLGSTNGTWLAPAMAGLTAMMRIARPTRWFGGWILWVSSCNGLEQDHRGWVRAVSR